jgi:hypothetical protein
MEGFNLVHRLANTLAFERRCIHTSFVALLHHTQRYASVARRSTARRIDALGASSYLRDGTLGPPPLSLLSWKPLLYYQTMGPDVLIPIAFLLAGSVAIILSVCMVR